MTTQTNIVALPAQKAPRKHRRQRPTIVRLAKAYGPAAGLGSVIAVLLGLSLTHLAHGIQIVTGCAPIEGTAMAIGLDLLIVALEVAMVATTGRTNRKVSKFANPALIAAFVWSAGLNAFAFASGAQGWMVYVAAVLGASIPALIYLGTRAWSAIAISNRDH
jgi:hypothetical protein